MSAEAPVPAGRRRRRLLPAAVAIVAAALFWPTAAGSTAAASGHVVAPVSVPVAGGAGAPSSYRLYRNPDGSPVRFDSCDPVTVRVNAPTPGAAADVREALGRLAAVSGLTFVDDGPTDFVPTRARRTLEGTDLVVAWAPAAGVTGGSDILDEGQLGTGGWTTAGERRNGAVVWRMTSAFAVLDLDRDADLEPGFGSGLTRGALLLHELSHALGVDHVDDPSQLMAPVLQRRGEPVAFGAGDLAALRAVGAGSCQSG